MTDVFTLRGPIKKDRPEPAKRSVTRKSLDGTELGSVDLEPTFRMRAGGSLTEARVALRAAYEDVEMDVRADGMTPPVIVKAPEPGSTKRRITLETVP